MARKTLGLTVTGLDEFAKDLDSLGDLFPIAARVAMEAESKVVEQQIKSNWVAIGGNPSGAMYKSISQTSNYAPAGSPRVGAFGKVGVFHIPNLLVGEDSNEDPEKQISRPQLAYWYEFGTQPHSTKSRGSEGNKSGESMNQGMTAQPFITTAYYSTIQEQHNAAVEAWDNFMREYV